MSSVDNMKTNPILVIDDDFEDQALISEAFQELKVPNELRCFTKAEEAVEFLKNSHEQPLFILCDINMPVLNGFDLRQIIYDDEKLRLKSIPFLFFSTAANRSSVIESYRLSVQGYFIKPASYEGIVDMLRSIIQYWGYCTHPNTYGLRED